MPRDETQGSGLRSGAYLKDREWGHGVPRDQGLGSGCT